MRKKILLSAFVLLLASFLFLNTSALKIDCTSGSSFSGTGYYWDNSSKKLVLENANIGDENNAVVLPDNSVIELKGDSSISGTVFCEGKLTIEGNGKLSVTSQTKAFNVKELVLSYYEAYSDAELKNQITVDDQKTVFLTPKLFTLNVSSSAGGKVSVTQRKSPYGTQITVIASAEQGYKLESWTCSNPSAVINESSEEITVVQPKEDMSIFAKFIENNQKYTVTIELTEPYSAVTEFGSKQFGSGDKVSLNCTPRDGYEFVGWSSNDVNISDANQKSAYFTMPEKDVLVTLGLKPITYKLKLETPKNGEVVISDKDPDENGYYSFFVNEEITISAYPDEDFVFGGWSATAGASFNNMSSSSTKVVGPASDFVLRAQFASSLREVTIKHGEGGTTVPDEKKTEYGVGCILDLLAVPDEGYEFSEWKCSTDKGVFNDTKSAETTFTMPDENCVITAYFKKGGYTLNIISTTGGNAEPKKSVHEMGEMVKVQATPLSGYVFSEWQCDDLSLITDMYSESTTFLMPAYDVKLTAVFKLATSIDSELNQNQNGKRFPIIAGIVIFIITSIVISLIIIKEKFRLSYKYLFKKFIRYISGK